jgi:hypothetical protein
MVVSALQTFDGDVRLRPHAPAVAMMHCAHCHLEVPLRATYLTLDFCPRCLAHERTTRPMTLTPSSSTTPSR